MEEGQTAMQYDELQELIEFIDTTERNYYNNATYPTEEEGEHFPRFKAFLGTLKKLYFQCAGCERQVSPDEERYQDPASEAWYCMKCLQEGI